MKTPRKEDGERTMGSALSALDTHPGGPVFERKKIIYVTQEMGARGEKVVPR